MLLFPEDPLRPRKVDEHFAPEAGEARWLHEASAVISVEMLERGSARMQFLGTSPPDKQEKVLYRGWMLSPEAYKRMDEAVSAAGYELVTHAEDYVKAHQLPGWYEAISAFTPATVWAATPEEALALAREKGWESAIVRDFSKSMKHDWEDACYIPKLAKKRAEQVVENFVNLRGEFLAGGIVLREFEQFSAVEARTWWRDGECVLATSHPDTPQQLPAQVDVSDLSWLPKKLTKAMRKLNMPFCSLDIAFDAEGLPRVVELGDGGVSDRPTSTDADDFLEAVLKK